jgi:hypothetical protein
MTTQLITPLIKEAIHRLCASFQVIFNGNDYSNLVVVGMEKPTWEEVLEKANEIELEGLKIDYKKNAKTLELEERRGIVGDASDILVAHWNNQKIIAEKILNKTNTAEEYLAFDNEIKARGLNEEMEEFCNKVINNSNIYTEKMCKITGLLKRVNLDIEASASKEEMIEKFQEFVSALKEVNL